MENAHFWNAGEERGGDERDIGWITDDLAFSALHDQILVVRIVHCYNRGSALRASYPC